MGKRPKNGTFVFSVNKRAKKDTHVGDADADDFFSLPPAKARSRQRRHGLVLSRAQRAVVATPNGIRGIGKGIGKSETRIDAGSEEEEEAERMVLVTQWCALSLIHI